MCALASAQSGSSSSRTHSSAGESSSKAEARQLTQDMSPTARSQLSRREAHAAYKEAMAACKGMSSAERKSCTGMAKANLRNDLTYSTNILADTGRENRSSGSSITGTMGRRAGSAGPMTAGNSVSSGATSGGGTRQGTDQAGSINNAPMSASERKQLVQDFNPRAQYNLARREAQAAYTEALATCKTMSKTERAACHKEARATFNSDLSHAKSQLQQGRVGESTGSSQSGSGSGM